MYGSVRGVPGNRHSYRAKVSVNGVGPREVIDIKRIIVDFAL